MNRRTLKPLKHFFIMHFQIMFCIWFILIPQCLFCWHFKFLLFTEFRGNILFPSFIANSWDVSHTCATASTHLRFNPLHIWLLKSPYYGNYSLNITTCLLQFNNLFSIRVLLNLSNSLDFWSLSLFIFLVLLFFSAISFSFSRAGPFPLDS